MRKSRGKQTTIRLDEYIVDAMNEIPGDNDAEKIRYFIRAGIDHDKMVKTVFSKRESYGFGGNSNEA